MVILSTYLGRDRKEHLMTANNAVKARDDPQVSFERTKSPDSPNCPPLKCHCYIAFRFDFIFMFFKFNGKENCVAY